MNPLKQNEILKEIYSDLMQNVDEEHKNGSSRFFKEKIKTYGVKSTIVRKLASKYYNLIKNNSKKEILEICDELLKTGYNENATIAVQWASKIKNQFEEKDFELFERWLDKYIDNWGKDDDFCMNILSYFIVAFPKKKDKIKSWTKSNNKWKRRASAVAFIQGGSWKIHPKYLKDVFVVAEDLIEDRDDLVQKGMGWMLKVASQPYEKEVFEFVMKHKSNMSRTALRYAIEKMPINLKKKAMEK